MQQKKNELKNSLDLVKIGTFLSTHITRPTSNVWACRYINVLWFIYQGGHSPGKQGNVFMKKSWKIHENSWKLSETEKSEIVLANVVENVDIAHYISIFFQKNKSYLVTFCYTVDKLESE